MNLPFAGRRPKKGEVIYPDVNRTHLASACGVHLGHMSKVLSGHCGVSVELAQRIANKIGVTREEFLTALEELRKRRADQIEAEREAERKAKLNSMKRRVKK